MSTSSIQSEGTSGSFNDNLDRKSESDRLRSQVRRNGDLKHNRVIFQSPEFLRP